MSNEEEEKGLLASPVSGKESSGDDILRRAGPRNRPWMKRYLIFSHIVFFLATIGLILAKNVNQCPREEDTEEPYSPAQSARREIIQSNYEVNRSMHSPYLGEPSPENDQAWLDLVNPTYLSLTEEEMVAAERPTTDSIRHEDESYLGVLAVYHQLHCLRRLRRFLYHGTYYPDYNSENESDYLHGHMDHCLEILRMAVMCHGDVSLYTYTWADDYPDAKHNIKFRSKKERKCVDWTRLEDWAKSRAVSWSPRLIDPNGEIVVANEQGHHVRTKGSYQD